MIFDVLADGLDWKKINETFNIPETNEKPSNKNKRIMIVLTLSILDTTVITL
jgi:hypothetical protein